MSWRLPERSARDRRRGQRLERRHGPRGQWRSPVRCPEEARLWRACIAGAQLSTGAPSVVFLTRLLDHPRKCTHLAGSEKAPSSQRFARIGHREPGSLLHQPVSAFARLLSDPVSRSPATRTSAPSGDPLGPLRGLGCATDLRRLRDAVKALRPASPSGGQVS